MNNTDVIQRIAAALAAADNRYNWVGINKTLRAYYEARARAALNAIPDGYLKKPNAIISVGVLPNERKVQVS